MIKREDVIRAYHLILGRDPESEAVISARENTESLLQLSANLFASDEFRHRLANNVFREDHWIRADIRNNLKIWVNLADRTISQACLRGTWEPAETNVILSVLRPGDTFIDIGANIGWFTILAAQAVGSSGRVYSYEPRKDHSSYLRRSIADNGFDDRCRVEAFALGAEEAEIELAWFPEERNPGHSFFVTGELPQRAVSLGQVPVRTLDKLNISDKVRMIKIDVEGAEFLVLRGARDLIARDRPILLIEIFPHWLDIVSRSSPIALLNLLREMGYRIFRFEEVGISRELQPENDASIGDEYFNIIAMTGDDCAMVLDLRLDHRVEELEKLLKEERQALAAADASAEARISEMQAALQESVREERQALSVAKDEAELSANAWRRATSDYQRASERLQSIEASTLWRMTHPIRRVGHMLPPRIRHLGRRGLKLTWWTLTLQLPRRIEAYRAARSLGHQSEEGSVYPIPAKAKSRLSQALPAPIRHRVLIIDAQWPRPDRDSGSIDAVLMIRALLKFGYEVIFAGEATFSQNSEYRQQLEAEGVICLNPSITPSTEAFIKSDGDTLSLCILSRVDCGGRYLEAVRTHAPKARTVFNTVDLHHIREEREARLAGNVEGVRAAEKTREREFYLTRQADATIVVSSFERDLLKRMVPGVDVYEMPLARSIRSATDIPGFEARQGGVGFVGGFGHPPNVDAVKYLLREIWPHVKEKMPNTTLTIVGADLPDDVQSELPTNARYLGSLPELDSWFDALRLTIAPLRYGAGAKGKVASSLAAGVPCVATPVAAEGMHLEDGRNVAIAASPEDFAARICELHEDPVRWSALSRAGHDHMLATFSIKAGEERLSQMLVALDLPVSAKLDGNTTI